VPCIVVVRLHELSSYHLKDSYPPTVGRENGAVLRGYAEACASSLRDSVTVPKSEIPAGDMVHRSTVSVERRACASKQWNHHMFSLQRREHQLPSSCLSKIAKFYRRACR
jgi:hypothetical protein